MVEQGVQGRVVSAGFTLIELLVVVVVVSVVTATVLLQFPIAPNQPLEQTLDRFSARLEQVCERALLSGEAHGAALTAAGYRFSVHRDRRWQELDARSGNRAESWPDGARPRLRLQGHEVTLPVRAATPQIFCTGLEPPVEFQLTLERAGRSARLSWPR